MERKTDIKYSLIFLNYDPQGVKDWVEHSKRSIIDSSAGYNTEFIEVKNVKGYVNAVNEGMKQATGDYLVILNDDVVIDDKDWLEKLCQPNSVMSWSMNPFHLNGEMFPDGACWAIPRDLYEKLGDMDTNYAEGYGCDEVDYFYRAKEAGYTWGEVAINMSHMQNKTYSSEYFRNQKEAMTSRNENYFYSKWKEKLHLK